MADPQQQRQANPSPAPPDVSLEGHYDPSIGALRLTVTPNAPAREGEGLAESEKLLQGAGQVPLGAFDGDSASRIAAYAGTQTPTIPLQQGEQQPATAPELPQALRSEYARSAISGETTGPQDFAERYAGMVGSRSAVPPDPLALAKLGKHVQMALPTIEESIDHGITVTQGAGADSNPDSVRDTRENLLHLWAQEGGAFGELADRAWNDPLMQEMLTQPRSVDQNPPDEGLIKTMAAPIRPLIKIGEQDEQSIWGKLLGQLIEPLQPSATEATKERLRKEHPDASPDEIEEMARLEEGQGSPYERTERVAKVIVGGIAGPVPGGALGAGPAILAGTAKFKRAVDPIKAVMGEMEDTLHLLQNQNEADMVRALQKTKKLDPAWLKQGFQENVTKEIEQRLIDPQAELSEPTRRFMAAVQDLIARQHSEAKAVMKLLSPADRDASGIELLHTNEGYVHRIVKGHEAPGSLTGQLAEADRLRGKGDVTQGGAGKQKTLSTFASGVQTSGFYVLERAATKDKPAIRVWPKLTLEQLKATRPDFKNGKLRDPDTGVEWTVKRPTMEEIEKHTELEYHKNFLANTVDNTLRLARVRRNLEALSQFKQQLTERGWFVPGKPGQTLAPPEAEGMVKVDLPQLQGWAQPRIANVLNDFYGRYHGDLDGFLTRANNLLTRMMFFTPVPHATNVATHWLIGRGWDHFRPRGLYSLLADGFRAVRAVATLNEDYMEHLLGGSGLMRASVETENYYKVMMQKLFNEQLGKPEWESYAKAFGFTVKQLVQAEYRWSRQTLWAINDMFMLQRQFELRRYGLSLQEAIRQAEKDIPNYRVPTEVLGSHAVSEALTNGKYIMFGRYHYGLLRAMGSMVRDLIGAQRSPAERLEALGKLTVLSAMAWAGANSLYWIRPGGPIGLILDVKDLFTEGMNNWVKTMFSIVSIGPAIDLAREVIYNQTAWGEPVVRHGGTALGNAAHVIEEAVGHIPGPGQYALELLKHGWSGAAKDVGMMFNLRLGPRYKESANAKAYARSSAHMREKRDPILGWFKQLGRGLGGLGGSAPPARRGEQHFY